MAMKDVDAAQQSYEAVPDEIIAKWPPEIRLRGLTPEQILAGLTPEERCAELTPEQAHAALEEYARKLGL
jgi:hypothetical protein